MLRKGQVYVDLNSTSPSVKVNLDEVIRKTGAHFVEGAILGAVGATGTATHVLTGGAKGQEIAETLTALGLNVSFYSKEIGKASMFKMLRSIFSKGMEALILELLIAGRRAGIEKDLWKDVSDFMSRTPFDRVASNWTRSHAVAFERRYHEMVQVRETMREIGLDPILTMATEAFFDRSRALGLDQAFPEKPEAAEAVVEYIERRLRGSQPPLPLFQARRGPIMTAFMFLLSSLMLVSVAVAGYAGKKAACILSAISSP
jgi:3-hydroxyisobutyrate dehydrogenase-like beta-hydroxyacid dehydrogenase